MYNTNSIHMAKNSILEFLGQRIASPVIYSTPQEPSPADDQRRRWEGKRWKSGVDYGGKGKVWLGGRQEKIMIERQGGAEKGGRGAYGWGTWLRKWGQKTWSEVRSLVWWYVGSLYGLLYVAWHVSTFQSIASFYNSKYTPCLGRTLASPLKFPPNWRWRQFRECIRSRFSGLWFQTVLLWSCTTCATDCCQIGDLVPCNWVLLMLDCLQSGFTSLVCPSVLKSDIGKTGETWWSDIKVDLRQFLMCLSGENGVV